MNDIKGEVSSLIIVDMIEANFNESYKLPITSHAINIIKPINKLINVFREKGFPVIFSTDAFTEQDFFFKGKMKPHSLAGTPDSQIISGLDYVPNKDYWDQKPSMSAFFKTGLEDWLRRRDVTLCVVAGIATPFCVLTTVLDSLSNDFKAILLEDCTASSSEDTQKKLLSIYRRNPLYPLFKILSSEELLI